MTINQIKIIHDVFCMHTRIVNSAPHLLSRTYQRRNMLDFTLEMLEYPVLMCYRRKDCFYGVLQGSLISNDASKIEDMEYKDLFSGETVKLDDEINSLVCFKLPSFKPIDPEIIKEMEEQITRQNQQESHAYTVRINTSCLSLSSVFGLQSVIGYNSGMILKDDCIYIEELEIQDVEKFKKVLCYVDKTIKKDDIKLIKI